MNFKYPSKCFTLCSELPPIVLGYSLLSIDETGKTALHYGARFGHKEIVKFLIGNAPYNILDMVDNEKG